MAADRPAVTASEQYQWLCASLTQEWVSKADLARMIDPDSGDNGPLARKAFDFLTKRPDLFESRGADTNGRRGRRGLVFRLRPEARDGVVADLEALWRDIEAALDRTRPAHPAEESADSIFARQLKRLEEQLDAIDLNRFADPEHWELAVSTGVSVHNQLESLKLSRAHRADLQDDELKPELRRRHDEIRRRARRLYLRVDMLEVRCSQDIPMMTLVERLNSDLALIRDGRSDLARHLRVLPDSPALRSDWPIEKLLGQYADTVVEAPGYRFRLALFLLTTETDGSLLRSLTTLVKSFSTRLERDFDNFRRYIARTRHPLAFGDYNPFFEKLLVTADRQNFLLGQDWFGAWCRDISVMRAEIPLSESVQHQLISLSMHVSGTAYLTDSAAASGPDILAVGHGPGGTGGDLFAAARAFYSNSIFTDSLEAGAPAFHQYDGGRPEWIDRGSMALGAG